jgi:hypothetical protein
MGYYDDALGTLEMGDTYLGAARGRQMARGNSNVRRPPSVPRSTLVPNVPGAPQPGLRLQPLGLGATAFTATSGLLLALQASPQKAFKAQRLIIDITRTGPTATGLITVTRIDVGADNMLVASGPLPASMFASNGVDLNVSFSPATPGITITVQVACSLAPTAPDRIDVSGGMVGTSYGQ